jgi:putative ABC transport system permease protein
VKLRHRLVVRPTRISVGDLVSEAAAGVLARPGRTALTTLGVILGVGTVVAVLGLTSTASGQVSSKFTALAATEVDVNQAPVASTPGAAPVSAFPADADQLAERVKGVHHAGVYQDITTVAGQVSGVPLPGATTYPLTVLAATPGFLPAIRATLESGRFFDEGAMTRADPVAVLGSAAAQRLGISRLQSQPVVFVGGQPLTVVGIVTDVARHADVLSSVIIPRSTALTLWPALALSANAGAPPGMVVDTALGAAPVVADQIALALRPDDPSALAVVPPPDPHQLQNSVQSDLNTLFLLLAAVSLVIGMLGIANTTLVAVLERTAEIGLRRALGARKRHVTGQFLTESAFIGTIGGVIGAAVGVIAIVGVAVARNWTPILDPAAVLPAPLLGSVVGVMAGLYPAARAARIPPAEAFRR